MRIEKEDLDKKNHLVGLTQTYLKLSFANVQDLMTVRSKLSPIVNKNKASAKDTTYGDEMFAAHGTQSTQEGGAYGMAHRSVQDVADFLLDLREYDVPYVLVVVVVCCCPSLLLVLVFGVVACRCCSLLFVVIVVVASCSCHAPSVSCTHYVILIP